MASIIGTVPDHAGRMTGTNAKGSTLNSNTVHADASREQEVLQLLAQGLCAASTECAPSYDASRQTLLQDERQAAWDAEAARTASKTEVFAGWIIAKIREDERVNIFGDLPGEAIPGPNTRDQGGRFLMNRPRIQQSKIFNIAQHMPKGAHLHVHFNTELPVMDLLLEARKLVNTMFIRSTRPLLQQEDFELAEIVFSVLPESTTTGNLFSDKYDPDFKVPGNKAWMRWANFRPNFPCVQFEEQSDNPRNLDPAERWVQSKMMVTLSNTYGDRQTTNGAWACFNQGTRALKGLLNYQSVYELYVEKIVDSMIRDRVMYAELRPMLLDKSIPADNGVDQIDLHAQMAIICRKLSKKRDSLLKEGRQDRFPFGFKIIYCTPRSIPRERMKTELEDCLKLKLAYPDLICGFDLVGAEDRPNHIGFYADLLVAFAKTCREVGVSVPFMFHAGETLIDAGGSNDPDKSNLYDSLLLNAKRIGHGYSLLKHPLLLKKYKEQRICLELCPISNELLHLCSNARQHIFPELLAAGLHCTLNADNPSLFSSSLSHEFYQVMVGDPRMSIHGWKQLAEWSIEHCCLNDDQRKEATSIFHKDWEAFCNWTVHAY